ncbi:MAG: ATP-dependent helicase [Pseudomonadota bacterium]
MTIASPDTPADFLAKLNAEQRSAATFGEHDAEQGTVKAGPLLIIAGAGTGKTMTLAHRVAHLVLSGVDAERILLLTFSRRAAQEMTRRAERIVREAQRSAGQQRRAFALPWSGTFHSVANRILRRYAANVGLDAAFTVLDRGDAADTMDLVRQQQGLAAKSRRFPRKDTCLAIYSRCVNTQQPMRDVLQAAYPWCLDYGDELTTLFRGYVELKQTHAVLDYDDLLLYWFHLVSEPALAEAISARFDHVLVDEYQDTNHLQAGVLQAMRPQGDGLTVVGDDAQSIYSFRAADVDNILNFPDQFVPAARVVTLEQNYRSVQPVLDSANTLIAESSRQYRKNLYSEKRSAQMPRYVTVEDGDGEADYIVSAVLAAREAGMALRDQAVLFRNAHHSDRLEVELTRHNIPFVKYGGLKFLESAHVKDLLSILKWADNPRNRVAAFRVLQLLDGIGPAHAARCFEYVAAADYAMSALLAFTPPASAQPAWPDFCELMSSLAGRAEQPAEAAAGWQFDVTAARRWYQPHLERHYEHDEQRAADLEQLEQISGQYPTRERFLTELTLDPPQSSGDLAGDPLVDEDYLILSTVHSAKGQEWDNVYVLNVTDGNFPSEFAAGDDKAIDEERRLLYVAMTRAKQELHLMAPLKFYVTEQQRYGGKHVYGARSRFMTESMLSTLEATFHQLPGQVADGDGALSTVKIDVGERIRQMW